MKKTLKRKLVPVLDKLLNYERLKWYGINIGKLSEDKHTKLIKSKVENIISKSQPLKVIWGPFKGLKYPSLNAVGSELLPKILGTYESELHQIIEELIKNDYDYAADIGAAEGYYANGIALRKPGLKMYAYDGDARGQELCRKMAEINGVRGRVAVSGLCTKEEILRLNKESPRGLIISDCEGGEIELFNEKIINSLKNADLIIELHDYSSEGKTLSVEFTERFKKTHEVTFVNTRRIKPIDHLGFLGLAREELDIVLSERRWVSVGWLVCRSRNYFKP